MTQRAKECAARAAGALYLYIEAGVSDEESAVRDLLADLRHYCDAHGISFGNEDRCAYRNYVEELG